MDTNLRFYLSHKTRMDELWPKFLKPKSTKPAHETNNVKLTTMHVVKDISVSTYTSVISKIFKGSIQLDM